MSTKISENTTYRTGCHDCGATSQDFRNRWDAEAWENTHNTSHHDTPAAVTDEVAELQKVNKRLVDHNTQLTRELDAKTVLLARMTSAWEGSQEALEKEEQAHRATVADYIELKAGLAAAEDELNDESNARAAALAQRDEARAMYNEAIRERDAAQAEFAGDMHRMRAARDDAHGRADARKKEIDRLNRVIEFDKANRDEAWELVDKADDERDTAHQSVDQMGHLNKRLRDERNAAVDDAKSLRAELTAAVAHVAAEQHHNQKLRLLVRTAMRRFFR